MVLKTRGAFLLKTDSGISAKAEYLGGGHGNGGNGGRASGGLAPGEGAPTSGRPAPAAGGESTPTEGAPTSGRLGPAAGGGSAPGAGAPTSGSSRLAVGARSESRVSVGRSKKSTLSNTTARASSNTAKNVRRASLPPTPRLPLGSVLIVMPLQLPISLECQCSPKPSQDQKDGGDYERIASGQTTNADNFLCVTPDGQGFE